MVPEVDFSIRVESGSDATTVTLAGELDLHGIPALTEALQAAASADRVVVDLCDVTFLDSTTLALLVQTQRRLREAGRELLVLVGAQTPLTAFTVTGFDRLLEIQHADTNEDAGPS